MKYLTKDIYDEITKSLKTNASNSHWRNPDERWKYFNESVNLVKTLKITDPKKVLEMGTMGVSIVQNCDSIDYSEKWNYKGKNPTYLHDARNIPWPIKDKQYDLFIALRVWQHLGKKQKDCFIESKRIAKNILIVVPDEYKNGFGVTLENITKWNNNVEPTIFKRIKGSTCLYFFQN